MDSFKASQLTSFTAFYLLLRLIFTYSTLAAGLYLSVPSSVSFHNIQTRLSGPLTTMNIGSLSFILSEFVLVILVDWFCATLQLSILTLYFNHESRRFPWMRIRTTRPC